MNMTPNEAYKLAEMMAKTWRNGPLQAAWSDLLQKHCEHDLAWQTFEQFRDTDDRPPGTGSFLGTYRRNAGQHHGDRATTRHCPTCDGSGMRTARQVIGGVEHGVVVACADCPVGIAAARTLTAIDVANANTNASYRQPHGPVIVDAHDTDDGPTMSFDEYIAVLTAKADADDTDAAQMLDVWAENLTRTPKGNL